MDRKNCGSIYFFLNFDSKFLKDKFSDFEAVFLGYQWVFFLIRKYFWNLFLLVGFSVFRLTNNLIYSLILSPSYMILPPPDDPEKVGSQLTPHLTFCQTITMAAVGPESWCNPRVLSYWSKFVSVTTGQAYWGEAYAEFPALSFKLLPAYGRNGRKRGVIQNGNAEQSSQSTFLDPCSTKRRDISLGFDHWKISQVSGNFFGIGFQHQYEQRLAN